MKSGKEIRFDLPGGFSTPEGKGEGDHIEVLATLELEADGRACLKEIDGYKMPGYDGDGEEHDGKSYPQAAADQFDKMKSAGGGMGTY